MSCSYLVEYHFESNSRKFHLEYSLWESPLLLISKHLYTRLLDHEGSEIRLPASWLELWEVLLFCMLDGESVS
ncbi:hypothetical protein L6452_05203 [Arctium lappa]|uniref:Uncharacterized protein n=1 Tax=Arctium lappa TaxID=4217 RepID=A0ACB9EG26_ARCLA|nr:hypothetical protein L6452_05203 [Arctium lappa]